MSVIQKIQEKYAKVMAVIIAVALITFVIMLAFENGGSLFGGNRSNTVGKVNGETIDYNTFTGRANMMEAQMKQQGYPGGVALTQEAMNQTWEQEVNRIVLEDEFEKLGLTIGRRELSDLLYGPNPPDQLRQAFTDPATNVYDPAKAKAQLDNVLKSGTAEEKANIANFLTSMELVRKNDKYTSLLSNSINFPKWMIEKQNADNSQIARVSFVRALYSEVSDSTVKVSDDEIADYVKKHKDLFKQEESRGITYVSFSALPTGADSTAAYNALMNLKPEFDSTSDANGFAERAGSSMPSTGDAYYPKSRLQQANQQIGASHKDTILTLGKNQVYGPYLDGSSYVLAKMIDSKVLPDSVKCRHILLGTVDRQGQPIMSDSAAKKSADSIALAIAGGANFDTLEARYSTDEVAGNDKGVMTFSSVDAQGENFAKEFGDFILNNPAGTKRVVKTQFGYHYIEILSHIKPETHYKIAYIGRQIEPSAETDAAANNQAQQFAANSRDQKTFNENADKLKAQGINKLVESNIAPTAYQLGLGVSRGFVRNIYEADLGDVLDPEKVGDNYVVAMVTEVNKKGTMSPAKARPMVEGILRNQKKADILTKKVGNVTTLEAAATALGGKSIESADSVRIFNSQTVLSAEPKVIGASFNPANKGKVVPQVIPGQSGVYVVRVDDVAAAPVMEGSVAEQRASRYQQARMRLQQMASQRMDFNLNALKEAADIKDNRADLF